MRAEDLGRFRRLLTRACAYDDVISRTDAAELLEAFEKLRKQVRAAELLDELYEAALLWSVADHTSPGEVRSDAQVEQNQRAADLTLLAALNRVRAALGGADAG